MSIRWAEIRYPYSARHSKTGGGEESADRRILFSRDGRCRLLPILVRGIRQLRHGCSKPGAQAYYDSIAKLYASWEVDLIKVDCISSRPYKGDEIRMLSTALAKSGAANCSESIARACAARKDGRDAEVCPDVANLQRYLGPVAQHGGVSAGPGRPVRERCEVGGKAQPGHWPDADMLPLGYLGPAPGWGKPRYTRLTHDEQRTFVTLWCIFPSPLMVGGDLPKADAWTISLLTNPEVIAVDQQSTGNHPVISTDKAVVWVAESAKAGGRYVAIFNLEEPVRASSIRGKTWDCQRAKYGYETYGNTKIWVPSPSR